MNHNSPGVRGGKRRPARQPAAWRLPLGRMRDLLALLVARGPVYAPVRGAEGPKMREVSNTMALSRRPMRPRFGPEVAVLPPADVFLGHCSAPPAARLGPEGVVLFGLPPCVVYDLQYLDSLLAAGPFRDAAYARRRRSALIVAMNCIAQRPGCRCAALGTGPRLRNRKDADLVLTPLGPAFLIETGSPAGSAIVTRLGLASIHKGRQGRPRGREQQEGET